MDYSSDSDGYEHVDANIFAEEVDDAPVTQEDAWAVISGYFDEKGLVRQQLDSFDKFVQNTIKEVSCCCCYGLYYWWFGGNNNKEFIL